LEYYFTILLKQEGFVQLCTLILEHKGVILVANS